MKQLSLTDYQYKYIKELLEKDAEEIANDVSFFDQLKWDPKKFVDDRVELCKAFDIDFWQCVADNCNHYEEMRLRALCEGIDPKKFKETYSDPGEAEHARRFLRTMFSRRQSSDGNSGV